jgi:hypothetical protein
LLKKPEQMSVKGDVTIMLRAPQAAIEKFCGC